MSYYLRINEILKLTSNEPFFFANLSANKQVNINNLILITLFIFYSHFTDEGTGLTEVIPLTSCKAEFRFFSFTIKINNIG